MPFIPFLLGMVTGSAITYIVKDESCKQSLEETGGKITSSVSTLTKKMTSMFNKAEESAEEVVKPATETTETA